MVDILSVLIVVTTSLATLTNVMLVAKRYKDIKDKITKTEKQINIASDKLKDASNILSEIKMQNHGVSPLDSGQKEQIQKLIEEINCQVKSTDSHIM